MKIEIDQGSGFCFGVTRAIGKAEEELAKEEQLYCLGDIVHNGKECDRLQQLGLVTINHEQLRDIHDAKVLLRAHGEPPSTYALADDQCINLIDATCPVVLHLQERIKKEYDARLPSSLSRLKMSRSSTSIATFVFIPKQLCRLMSSARLLTMFSSTSVQKRPSPTMTPSVDKWQTACLIFATLLFGMMWCSLFAARRAVTGACSSMNAVRPIRVPT